MLLQHQAVQPRAVLACLCPVPVRLPRGLQGGLLAGQRLICVCPGGSVGGQGVPAPRGVCCGVLGGGVGAPCLVRHQGCGKAPMCCTSSSPVTSVLSQMLSLGPAAGLSPGWVRIDTGAGLSCLSGEALSCPALTSVGG